MSDPIPSQTQALKIFRETALPATLQAYSIYMIAPTARPDYVEIYVTDSAGAAKRVINQLDIETLISDAISAAKELLIVADIDARDDLTPDFSQYVFVIDATDDPTVSTGGATYLYNTVTSSWIKISESESLDVVLNWTDIVGGPTSTPTEIDAAVAAAHTHANKTQLDKISEDEDGNLTYSGKLPLTGWSSTSW
jgi:hypothetical protein